MILTLARFRADPVRGEKCNLSLVSCRTKVESTSEPYKGHSFNYAKYVEKWLLLVVVVVVLGWWCCVHKFTNHIAGANDSVRLLKEGFS